MLESLLANTDSAQPWLAFVRNIVFGALLAMLLEQVYTRYGHSLSNRSAFARHFYLLTMTTTLIITVVQSSLALSLGLIGALSIVRFRAAIKEPEELVYIFLGRCYRSRVGREPVDSHADRGRHHRRGRLATASYLGFPICPPRMAPFIHLKAAQRTKRLFVTASSRFRGRQLSAGGRASH